MKPYYNDNIEMCIAHFMKLAHRHTLDLAMHDGWHMLKLIILFLKGWLFMSFKDSLFFYPGVRHLRMKSFRSSDKDLSKEMLLRFIYSINCFSLVQFQGAFP